MAPSSSEFIAKASGIKARYVMDKAGVLDLDIMRPRIATRGNDEPSLLAEMGVAAATQALERAGRTAADVDFVIAACSNMPRRSEEHTSELQSLMRISYAVFCLNKNNDMYYR